MPAARTESLTALGRALGCGPVNSKNIGTRSFSTDGLPEACYYSGPLSELGPIQPRPSRTWLERPTTPTERDARELAERGEERLLRFFQMLTVARQRRTSKKAQRAAC